MSKFIVEYYSYGGRTLTVEVEAEDEDAAASEARMTDYGPEDDVFKILSVRPA